MHRRALIDLLDAYAGHWPDDAATAARFVDFVARHPDCLQRTCRVGHITASAWILTPGDDAALLAHHKKLGRWLQLGGHVDGEAQVERAALREAVEESGMARFELVRWAGPELVPLDLDVHPIPAHGNEPAHAHWDVRFLLRAAPDQEPSGSPEAHEVRWFPLAELATVTTEESVLRLHRKACRLLGVLP